MSELLTIDQAEHKVIKDKILELVKQLPAFEQIKYEAMLLGFEIREEYSVLMSDKDSKTSSIDLEESLKKVQQKKKALSEMMELDKDLRKIFDDMSDDEKEEFLAKGASVRSVIKTKAKNKYETEKKIRNEIKQEENGNLKKESDKRDSLDTRGSNGGALVDPATAGL